MNVNLQFLQSQEPAVKTETSTVTSKGQLVIPSKLRRKFGIRKGTQVAFVEEQSRLILQPLTPEFIQRLRGSLKGLPAALDVLLKERKTDRKL
jgi:AbrB family looped-hinge helix DNA binding protein